MKPPFLSLCIVQAKWHPVCDAGCYEIYSRTGTPVSGSRSESDRIQPELALLTCVHLIGDYSPRRYSGPGGQRASKSFSRCSMTRLVSVPRKTRGMPSDGGTNVSQLCPQHLYLSCTIFFVFFLLSHVALSFGGKKGCCFSGFHQGRVAMTTKWNVMLNFTFAVSPHMALPHQAGGGGWGAPLVRLPCV